MKGKRDFKNQKGKKNSSFKKGGKKSKKEVNNNSSTLENEEEDQGVSKSFVFRRGDCNKLVKQLVQDFRKVMEPNTAAKLKETPTNSTKDFVNVASLYGVTHLVAFSNTDIGTYVSIGKTPKGPTITFKVNQYSLVADVTKAKIKSSTASSLDYLTAPLVVLNNFTKGVPHLEMMSTMLQGLFPSINVLTLQLAKCKRIVLFNYNKEDGTVEFRHYKIRVAETGISKSIKRVIQSKVPDISKLDDISDYVLGGTGESESDYEDANEGKIDIDSKFLDTKSKKTIQSNQKAIKLEEIGPRMTLDLIKVEDDLFKGGVLYHKFVSKTEQEIEELNIKKQDEKIEKQRRIDEQNKNVEDKKKKDEEKKKRKYNQDKKNIKKFANEDDGEEDDDEEWYRQEVGEEPDETFKSGLRNGRDRRAPRNFKKQRK
ncbi:brix domain-containing protein [Heterostelium album PN500]|uniref:Brix domain-containing protein n=1 Tax=Heterostelium pallidum (strain ATCC 26659 / Pp 5 / PN500) TaxID=670386 RepID=D3BS90_HETP5|nr:brix domain-containing protein [Heterostelium album PN500]EFA75827.1 brix domain-containing protein [Heterostelium album PN500]|eukprot:XP_020427961.1 brix domain-containing protein [Heterostelium album PN500]